jgi:eukaryotic-like serine/threonine-protein kinase
MEEPLLQDNLNKYPDSWSPDGRFVIYESLGSSRSSELLVLPLTGDRKPFPLLQTQFGERDGRFSPDGRWVAYRSNESGRNEIYVAPFPGPGGKWQISTAGGYSPRWRHDGSEIFYLTPDNRLMAASVNGKGAGFEVGAVKPLFATRIVTGNYQYDVSSDGQRFLIDTSPEQATSAPITIVLNWAAGLKK